METDQFQQLGTVLASARNLWLSLQGGDVPDPRRSTMSPFEGLSEAEMAAMPPVLQGSSAKVLRALAGVSGCTHGDDG